MQTELVAGDTLNEPVSLPDYLPSDGWTAKLRLVPRVAGTAYTYTATVDTDSDSYIFEATAAQTALWAAGYYSWTIWAEKAGERYTLPNRYSGQLLVKADPATMSGGTDTRSAAQIALDNVRAVLHGRASDGVLRYQINGRSLERYSMADLLALESKLVRDVAAEADVARAAQGLASSRKVYVRMGRA